MIYVIKMLLNFFLGVLVFCVLLQLLRLKQSRFRDVLCLRGFVRVQYLWMIF